MIFHSVLVFFMPHLPTLIWIFFGEKIERPHCKNEPNNFISEEYLTQQIIGKILVPLGGSPKRWYDMKQIH